MSRHHWVVRIACSSLQSLQLAAFDVSCSALFATHDFAFHIPDGSFGIPFDTHGPDDSYATSFDGSDKPADKCYLQLGFSSSRRVYLLYGIIWRYNTSDS